MSEIQRIFDRISTRLNNALCEMKPGYDDSIVGFNEAWDIVRAVFKDELAKAHPVAQEAPEEAEGPTPDHAWPYRQALKVMPLIGPLLDAWEAIPNDEMTALVVAAPHFHSRMLKLVNAIESET